MCCSESSLFSLVKATFDITQRKFVKIRLFDLASIVEIDVYSSMFKSPVFQIKIKYAEVNILIHTSGNDEVVRFIVRKVPITD